MEIHRVIRTSTSTRRRLASTVAALSAVVIGSAAVSGRVEAEVTFEQLGDAIIGERFSMSGMPAVMSADGSRVAIGAMLAGERRGRVSVVEWTGDGWAQLGAAIEGPDGAPFPLPGWDFGVSLAMSADGARVAVGAWRRSTVSVFDWDGSAWVQVGDDVVGDDYSGDSVALSADGRRLAVGAIGADDAGTNSGRVRVFDWDGSAWVQVGDDIDGEAAGDGFEAPLSPPRGDRIAMSADGLRLAVGAQYNDGAGTDAGHVRVFDWDGSAWVQAGDEIDGEAAGDRSGQEVALAADGNRLAIGARGNDGAGGAAGHVRVFDWDGSAWVQAGDDIDGEAAGDLSGLGIALTAAGDRLAIGAMGHGLPRPGWPSPGTGQVRVFDWDGSAWVHAGSALVGASEGAGFRGATALSADGTRLAVGAPMEALDRADDIAGRVRVFEVRTIAPTTTVTSTTLPPTTTAPTTTATPTIVAPGTASVVGDSLPATGAVGSSAAMAIGLVGCGIVLVLAARRRSDVTGPGRRTDSSASTSSAA